MTKKITGAITIVIVLVLTIAASIKALVEANNDQSDKLEIDIMIENLKTYTNDIVQDNNKFQNRGRVELNEDKIIITSMSALDRIEFDIRGTNKSNIKVKCRYVIEYENNEAVPEQMKITSDDISSIGMSNVTNWQTLDVGSNAAKMHYIISLNGAEPLDKAEIKCKIEVVKEETMTNNPSVEAINIYNVLDILKFKQLLKEKEEYQTKKVILLSDLDLNNANWEPFTIYKGEFDGGYHTIKNLYIANNRAYGNGFFGDIRENAVIKNITFQNAKVLRENANDDKYSGNVYGIVAGYAYNNVELNNVSVISSEIIGYGKVAPLIGMAADEGGTTKITNCLVKGNSIKATYNVGNLIGLALNKVELTNNKINDNIWHKDKNATYVELDTTLVKDSSILVKGLYMKYENEGTIYYYSAWSNNYNDYKYVDEELASGGKLVGLNNN